MAGEQNLISIGERTKDEQRAITQKGGIASGVARRQKKTLKQIGDMIGNLNINNEKKRAIMREAGIQDEDMVNDVGMLFRLNMKAQQGDTRAIELLAKLRGQLKDNDLFGGASVSSITINFGGKTVDGEEAK